MQTTVAHDRRTPCPAVPRAAHVIRSTDAVVADPVGAHTTGCAVTTARLNDGAVGPRNGATRRRTVPAARPTTGPGVTRRAAGRQPADAVSRSQAAPAARRRRDAGVVVTSPTGHVPDTAAARRTS